MMIIRKVNEDILPNYDFTFVCLKLVGIILKCL